MSKDYYKVLGIDKNASQEEVKLAFRKLAHKFHPDKEGGDEQKFKEINEAYQVLSNPEKRKQFDQFGSNFDQPGNGFNWQNSGYGQNGFSGNINMDDLSDLFSGFGGIGDMFGFGNSSRQKKKSRSRGSDIEVQMQITFEEAVFGAKKEIELYKTVKCGHCNGNKAEPGTKINTCAKCNGTGMETRIQQTFIGAIKTQSACRDCGGEGKIPEKKCTRCGGSGIVKENSKIRIEIPAGVEESEILKMSGFGEAGFGGGVAGDLYIHFRVKKHAEFERRGKDIFSKKEISFATAALGGDIDVKTVHGDVVLKIPSATQNNKVFRLKNKGVLNAYAQNGDHFVEILVNVPERLSKRQKELLKEFDEEGKKKWF